MRKGADRKRILLRCATMIIQQVIKGLSNLTDQDVDEIFQMGIICNWWRTQGHLPQNEVPDRLTELNLDWHSNRNRRN